MNWNHPHTLARRERTAAVIIIGVFVFLAGAFFRLQVLSSDRYAVQSRQNRLRPVVLPAPRGLIVDRNGIVIAENVPSYTISILAPDPTAFRATLDSMATYANLEPAQLIDIVQRYERSPDNPVIVMRDAPFEVVAALEERRPSLRGMIVQTEPKRHYPYGELVSHLLGYVGEISEEEMESGGIIGARLGALVGRGGLEAEYDERLRGFDGTRFVVVDALGRRIGDDAGGGALDARQGDTLHTSLDVELQKYAADNFPAGRRGAVAAMDPRNGEILAMYSAPSFDPNEFIGGIDEDLWNEWLSSEDTPLLNRAIQGIYPPASPWKLVVALMALERGVVELDTKMLVPCTGGYQYFNRYFRCWRATGHGYLTLAEAIEHSCDVYFYQLGLKLGLDSMLLQGAEWGLREKTGVDLPGEVSPDFPASTAYFDELYGPRGWTNAVTLNLAIGQGENSQTLISMIRFYSLFARGDGGVPVPRFVVDTDVPQPVASLASAENVLGLRDVLEMVVQSGTAVRSRVANLRIAGKTGTAQNSHGPNHGWFVGFAPVDDPQIVVGAIVEFGEHGSSVAPFVNRIIARHLLGPDSESDRPVRWILPADSAPQSVPISGDSSVVGNVDNAADRTR